MAMSKLGPERSDQELTGADPPPPGRRERAKARTRRRLIAGARELIGVGGVDAVTVADVTDRADVGFGTFYGYFASTKDLTRAVVEDALERLGRANDELTSALDDPAEVLAVAVRNTLSLVVGRRQWASFMVKVAYSDGRELWSGLHDRVVRDVGRGIAQGRFRLEDPEIGAVLVTGAVLSALRDLVEGRLAASSITEVATRILVMLGVPAEEAARFATRPLPVLGVLPDETDGHDEAVRQQERASR